MKHSLPNISYINDETSISQTGWNGVAGGVNPKGDQFPFHVFSALTIPSNQPSPRICPPRIRPPNLPPPLNPPPPNPPLEFLIKPYLVLIIKSDKMLVWWYLQTMLVSIEILFSVVVKYIGNNPGSIKSNNVALCSSCSWDKDQVLNVKRSRGEVYDTVIIHFKMSNLLFKVVIL